jgi:signal transduction histidine kinase
LNDGAPGEPRRDAVDEPWFGLVRALVHDLRTPIATASGYLELIELDAPEMSATHAEYLQRAAIALREISSLTTTLMEVARLESGRRTVHGADVDAARLAARVAGRRRPIERPGLELRLPPAGGPRATCDAELVDRAVESLLDLALARSPSGQPVVLSLAAADDGGVRFAVRDFGTPIDDERLAQLFSHHLSGAAGASAARLALVYCRLVALAHGGRAGASRPPEGGMEFWLELPANG